MIWKIIIRKAFGSKFFFKKSKSILVGCFYRPPESSKYLPKDFCKLLKEQLTRVVKNKKEIIIVGDFNIDYHKENVNKDFKSLLNAFGLKQVITKSTRVTKTTATLIDLIITNKPENIIETNVFQNSISDHILIACRRKINCNYYKMRTIKCRNYARYSSDDLRNDVSKVNWTSIYQ